MSNEEWNGLQNNVFTKLFNPVVDGISSKYVISLLEYRRNVWKKFNNIIGSDIEPDNDRFSVIDIDRIEYNGRIYLIIKYGFWDFIVIDVQDMTCLSQEDGISIVKKNIFNVFRRIDEETIKYCSFDKLNKKTIKKVLDFYIEYQDVLNDQRKICYEFYNSDDIRATFSINCDSDDIIVGINDFKDGRCNYIYLDFNLRVYGASNLTGNKYDIGKMFDGSRDIMLPNNLICDISKYINEGIRSYGDSFSINKQV